MLGGILVYFLISVALSLASILPHLSPSSGFFITLSRLANSVTFELTTLNMLVASGLLVYAVIIRIFLGSIRTFESEKIAEATGVEATKSLLVMMFLRDRSRMYHIPLYIALLFTKMLHRLCHERIQFPCGTHRNKLKGVRFLLLIMLVAYMDIGVIGVCAIHIANNGISISLVFFFEFLTLLTTAVMMFIRFLKMIKQESHDTSHTRPSDEDILPRLYLGIIENGTQLTISIIYFISTFLFYECVWYELSEVLIYFNRIVLLRTELSSYRNLLSMFELKYPRICDEALANRDCTCVICHEDMAQAHTLPCGHIYHSHCLREWLSRSKVCPTCWSPSDRPSPNTSKVENQSATGQNFQSAYGQDQDQGDEGVHHLPFDLVVNGPLCP